MESCFRGNSVAKNRDKKHQRHSTTSSSSSTPATEQNHLTINKDDTNNQIIKPRLKSQIEMLPKLEILQDLDLYYIRQIANSLKELDLEQKIDLEIKMREGSSKLITLLNNNNTRTISKGSGLNSTNAHSQQILEAAKNLLTSNERMTAYMAELQRRKRDRDTIARSKPTGKISFSELRMPLMWRDTDHFKNKGDHRRFAIFCLVKIGTEIYDTSLFCPVDRNLTDISFNDVILFSNINPDFKLQLEIYSVMMEADLSIASTPRKIKNTIHSSISRTVGKRLAANLKEELNSTKIGPKFDLIATAELTLTDASDLPHTHDLTMIPNHTQGLNLNNKLPLFGHFCCRLAVQPDSMEQHSFIGDLQISAKEIRSVDGYGRLQGFLLELWDNLENFNNNIQPRRTIEIIRTTKLKQKNPNELSVCNMEEGKLEEYLLQSKVTADITKLYGAIKKIIKEHLQWDLITLTTPMKLSIPDNTKQYYQRQQRQGSLYDQVPTLVVNNKETNDIFSMPNSEEFRTRTYSYSRSSQSSDSLGSNNSRKSHHWPFSGK